MERRTILALVLSFGVLFFYPMLLRQFYPDYGKKPPAPAESPAPPAEPDMAVSAPTASTVAGLGAGAAAEPEKDVVVRTAAVELAFHPSDGGVRRATLLRFHDAAGQAQSLFAQDRAGLSPTALHLPLGPAGPWSVDAAGSTVSAECVSGALRLKKTVSFRADGHSADVTLRFENTGSAAADASHRIVVGPAFPSRDNIDPQYIEANFYDGARVKHVKESKAGRIVRSDGAVRWAATKDRHFAVILRPEDAYHGVVEGLGDHRFSTSLASEPLQLAPGASLERRFLLYIGPNNDDVLSPLGLEALVTFGKLDAIAKLLIGALEMLHGVLRNYGLAIIAFTVLLNLMLFPLTRASYRSMKRMQLIQPQMNRLKEQHKKNPEKMHKEMMELYRKHKVNPFGGCLPMLFQMPVFMALYVAFCKSAELVGQRFLWVADLSTPDVVPLPFSLPLIGSRLHVLPLLLIAVSVLQQRFMQFKIEGQDPAIEAQQKMMAWMMPVMLGFIFYGMPSGYVLYFLVNSLLMTLYQMHLKKMTL